MAEKYGWWSPFWVLAAAGIILGVVVSLFLREPRHNQAERAERGGDHTEPHTPHIPIYQFLAEFIRTPTAVLLVVAFFGAMVVGFVFLTWMPKFLTDKFHLGLAAAGLGATLFIQLFSMVGIMIGGVVADRWSRTRPEARILVQAIGVLVSVPFVFLCGYTSSPWILIVAMSLVGLGKGMYDSNLTPAFYDVIAPARRGTATGLMNFIGFSGAGLGSYAIGFALDHKVTMSAAISSTAVISLLVAAILFYTAISTGRRDILAARKSRAGGPAE